MATKAQKAAAKVRRETMKVLAKELGSLSPADRQAMSDRVGLVSTIEGRPLSMTNTLMVASQAAMPVTVVGGFRQWKNAGRSVRKGSKGMAIWIPKRKAKDEDDEDSIFFSLGTVFDVAQTEDMVERAHADALELAAAA